MKIGDLVRELKINGKYGIITKIHEPTIAFPVQLVTVQFFDGELNRFEDEYVSRFIEVIN
jgi:hypothetical protein